MITAIAAGVSAAFLLGDFIYHRWIADKPREPSPEQEVTIPRVDNGIAVPLIFGRVRVRHPLLIACADPFYVAPDYQMNMVFRLGIPFDDGNGINRVHNMWAGDWKLIWTDNAPTMTGDGGPEGPVIIIGTGRNGENFGLGLLEFLNGKPTQIVAQDGATVLDVVTSLGKFMLRPRGAASGHPDAGGFGAGAIPSQRGFITVCLFGVNSGEQWRFGSSPTVPAYSFEVSSYRDGGGYPAVGIYAQIGMDSNPINVLYDLLKAKFGKLGVPASVIDSPSFQSAASTLASESHGYSRCFDNATEVDEHIQEILRQIDGVLYEDTSEGTIKIKLIRNDYDPNAIPHITKDNCDKITNFSAGGWTNLVNKIRVVYTNRDKDYNDDDEQAQNPANAVGQDGIVNEQVIQFPGVCYQSLALALARRELAARSRPIMKMRALVNRTLIDVNPGDAVKVTWPGPSISGLIFRVANVERGKLDDNIIALDLIQDYYYVWRNQVPLPPYEDPGLDLDGGLTLG